MISPHETSELPILLEAARTGDRAALGRLTEACRPYLLKIANDELDSGLRVKTAASDLVQEALLEGQQAFDQFLGGSEDELLIWLRRIMTNNLIDEARRYREAAKRDISKERPLDGEQGRALRAGQKTPLEEMVGIETQAVLEFCLARLPEEGRRAIEMREIEQKTFAQIGAELSKSAEAARKVWFNALGQLRKEMKSHGQSGSSIGSRNRGCA